uniref:Uncharacterized protein n=1 Tax=Romanomermis culicivorax TaxID=13658 RepID=A0A915K2A1_ROMCU
MQIDKGLFLIFVIKCINAQTISDRLVPDCESLLSLNLTRPNNLKDTNLSRCYCDRVSNKSDQDLQINCVHLTDLNELTHAITSVNNSRKNLVEIHIRGFNLTTSSQKSPINIPDKFFAGILPIGNLKNLKEISLTECIVGDWKSKEIPLSKLADQFKFGKEIFHGLEKSLKSLKIRNCPSLDQILNLIRNLSALDTLELSNVNLKSIHKGDFDGFQNLKSLG